MYALADITKGDCYLRVPPDPGTVAAALGAGASPAPGASASAAPSAGTSPLSGTAPTESFHTFTLDSGASRSFFRDSTTLTPLSRPVAVSLADPSGGPVLAHSSTVLPCPAAPSGLLSGLHLPSFSTNLGPAPLGVSQVDLAEPVEVAVDSGAARGADPAGTGTGGAESGGAETGGAGSGGAEPRCAEPGGVAPEGTVFGGAEHARAVSGGALGVPSRREPLSPQRLREWYSRRCWVSAGAEAAGGAAGAGGALGATGGAGATGGGAATGAARGTAGAGAAGGAAGTGDPGVEDTGPVSAVSRGAARPRPYYVPLLQQPASPLPGPSPYSGPTRGLMERRKPESRSVSPESRSASPIRHVRAGRTHSMTLRPSTAPQHVPLPSTPASSLPDGPDPESHSLRAASPTITRFLATAVADPLFESSAASALVAELVDFVAACRLDYAASLVAESASASVCPPIVGGECALGTDVLEDRQEDLECFAAASPHLVSMLLAPEGDPDALDIPTPRSYAEAIEGPYSSQWQAAMDAEMASWKSTGTYVDEVPPLGANIGVDFFQTFSPTPKMTTLRVLLHVAAQRDYELHSLDFSTAFVQGSLHEEIWLRRPPGFTGSFPAGTQWSLRRPVYSLRQAPREWHDTLRTTLAALGFSPSTADPSLFLRTDATLPPFYVLVYVDDLVFATGDTEALAHVKSEIQKLHTCTDLGPSVLRLHLLLATVHSSAYRSLALSSTFGRVRGAKWPVSRACELPHVPDDLHTT
ncbi:unnamed protein product [Closterium sp. NIES-54]